MTRRCGILAVLVILTAFLPIIATPANASAPNLTFLAVKGTRIVDQSNHTVILRGVNYPGYSWCSSDSDPEFHREADYEKLARSGFNVVRLPISWCLLEPVPGMFLKDYLNSYISRDVRFAKKYGLHVVLDMHQWEWASRFGGEGAPDWTAQQYPNTDSGQRMAISNFWVNQTLQEHLINVWKKIATAFANEPTIAGYDVFNEPSVYTSVVPYLNETYVDAFYMRTIESIRTVDSKHIIFLEPSNMGASNLTTTYNIVWSPHFYPLSFYPHYYPENITYLEADLAAKYTKFVIGMKQPMWIGEFGAFTKDGNEAWLAGAKMLFSKYNIGWAWWAFDGIEIPTCLATASP